MPREEGFWQAWEEGLMVAFTCVKFEVHFRYPRGDVEQGGGY